METTATTRKRTNHNQTAARVVYINWCKLTAVALQLTSLLVTVTMFIAQLAERRTSKPDVVGSVSRGYIHYGNEVMSFTRVSSEEMVFY